MREPFLAVVYERRRVGKTALVLKFLEERPHLYFFVNPRKPPRFLLEEYGEALRRAAGCLGTSGSRAGTSFSTSSSRLGATRWLLTAVGCEDRGGGSCLVVAGEGGPLRHEVEFVLAEALGGEYRTTWPS